MKAIEILEDSPVIAAVKDEEGLKRSFESECGIIFILYGNICNITQIVRQVKEQNKIAIVHADLVLGFAPKEVSIDFIHQNTGADGIISTKPQLVKRASELGMLGILRAFMIDSMAMGTTKKQISAYRPDMLEILPGVIPTVIAQIRECTDIPIIASGLITDKKEIMQAFDAGADAISTTRQDLWFV
ncbi:MAG: glycerol-3-phosphate responsive antiterminator [Clostridiales bacterium]|nr:glycerol-3-phosphate responsive antiterminator [Clostridiales bacterium]